MRGTASLSSAGAGPADPPAAWASSSPVVVETRWGSSQKKEYAGARECTTLSVRVHLRVHLRGGRLQ
eukprot:15435211-Alexandrium_andersonii.AAC.1